MKVEEVIRSAQDAVSGRRVFGKPYERDGLTVIPAARVIGGGGGGGGQSDDGAGSGSGFGLSARPAGVYLIKDGTVRWRPAIDVNRAILGAQVLVGIGLLTLRSAIKPRSRSRRRRRR